MGRFSETVMDHFMEPRNRGPLDDASGVGVSGSPGAGPFLVFYLKTQGHRIVAARFESHECGATVASGSALTELVTGQDIDDCRELSIERLIDALDGLPADKQHCAGMAIYALQHALTAIDEEAGGLT